MAEKEWTDHTFIFGQLSTSKHLLTIADLIAVSSHAEKAVS